MNAEEENILKKQIEIDTLEVKLAKKQEGYNANLTLDKELLYSKKLALRQILEAK